MKPKFVERVWGRASLKPWYEETGTEGKIGEAWLTGAECVIEGGENDGRTLGDLSAQCVGTLDGKSGVGEFPLLVKMLFPEEKLSVQVHPNDEEAKALGLSEGRRSAGMCWRRCRGRRWLRAEKGAGVDELRAGAVDGTMEGCWRRCR